VSEMGGKAARREEKSKQKSQRETGKGRQKEHWRKETGRKKMEIPSEMQPSRLDKKGRGQKEGGYLRGGKST